MTSKPTPAPLRLELRPSRRLLGFLLLSHVVTAFAVLLASASLLIKLLAVCLAVFSLAYQAVRLYHRRWRVEAIGRDETGWWLQRRGQREYAGLRACWVTAYAAGLTFAGPMFSRHSLVIMGDACEADVFRQLRVQLRFAPGLEDGIARLG